MRERFPVIEVQSHWVLEPEEMGSKKKFWYSPSRERRLEENRVSSYVERGRGGIYWSASEAHGPSPIELVRRSAATYPETFRPAFGKLDRINDASIDDVLHRIPDEWMSRSAMDFAKAMTLYNIDQVREVLR